MSAAQKLITDVIAAHWYCHVSRQVGCCGTVRNGCGWRGTEVEHQAHVAAEIDKALGGLTREVGAWGKWPDSIRHPSRWVSAWKCGEEQS